MLKETQKSETTNTSKTSKTLNTLNTLNTLKSVFEVLNLETPSSPNDFKQSYSKPQPQTPLNKTDQFTQLDQSNQSNQLNQITDFSLPSLTTISALIDVKVKLPFDIQVTMDSFKTDNTNNTKDSENTQNTDTDHDDFRKGEIIKSDILFFENNIVIRLYSKTQNTFFDITTFKTVDEARENGFIFYKESIQPTLENFIKNKTTKTTKTTKTKSFENKDTYTKDPINEVFNFYIGNIYYNIKINFVSKNQVIIDIYLRDRTIFSFKLKDVFIKMLINLGYQLSLFTGIKPSSKTS